MIELSFKGRVKNKKRVMQFAEDVMDHYFDRRLKRLVEVEIKFVTLLEEGGVAGYCSGDRNSADVEIARDFSSERILMLNLAHELVHAKQFIRGEMNGTENWHGLQRFADQKKLPWEVEAYEMEERLVQLYYDNDDSIIISSRG